MVEYPQVNTFIDTALMLATDAGDLAIINYAIKKLKKSKLSDNGKKLAAKRFMHMAALHPYLLQLMEEYVFSPYGVDINDIKAFSDTIYQNATKINDYESLCYAIYFAIRFDFVLNGFEIDYIAAQDYVIKSKDCLLLTMTWIYFMKQNHWKRDATQVKPLNRVAMELKNSDIDRYWLFWYEALSWGSLPSQWRLMKQAGISFNIKYLVRDVLLSAQPDLYDTVQVETQISKQSGDIALGVDKKGAGDQGMMFGYATKETGKMLPLPFVLATEAIDSLQTRRHSALLPDAKAQVTYDYRRHRIDTFLISTQHKEDVEPDDVLHLCKRIMENVADAHHLNKDFRVLVNPTGRFVTGGSFADTGVTGRKIMCDTYGGACRHGGGAFSGKDPTKVDRSGAYMARKIAKDILRHGFARRCEVQLAYAIGIEEPVSVYVNTFHTGKVPAAYLVGWIRKHYDLTPAGIISSLGLRDVNYNNTATLGHFWHQWMPWEE